MNACKARERSQREAVKLAAFGGNPLAVEQVLNKHRSSPSNQNVHRGRKIFSGLSQLQLHAIMVIFVHAQLVKASVRNAVKQDILLKSVEMPR